MFSPSMDPVLVGALIANGPLKFHRMRDAEKKARQKGKKIVAYGAKLRNATLVLIQSEEGITGSVSPASAGPQEFYMLEPDDALRLWERLRPNPQPPQAQA